MNESVTNFYKCTYFLLPVSELSSLSTEWDFFSSIKNCLKAWQFRNKTQINFFSHLCEEAELRDRMTK
uniref:Uncharacterized protein n=1 Tax=Zonotrichia albicollis TaxID=44394 RepID=A0A8D2MR82_ZONAL